MLEAYGAGPYTGRELPDLRNRFFATAASQTQRADFQNFQLETQLRKAFLITTQNIFRQKTVEVEREAMTFEASHHTVIPSNFLQQDLVNC